MHTSKTTGKKYVGITCQEPWEKRFNGDGSGYRNCVHFWHAIQKYGWDDFEHEIITRCETEKEANELEKYFIALYQTNNDEFGYNIKEGGEHQTFPQEVRNNISKGLLGIQTRGIGWKHSEETKLKIKNAQKGRPLTPEHAENCRRATREYYKTHSPAHTFTEEDHIKSREVSIKQVRIVETGQIFESMTECAKFLNTPVQYVSRCIRLKAICKGYHVEKTNF